MQQANWPMYSKSKQTPVLSKTSQPDSLQAKISNLETSLQVNVPACFLLTRRYIQCIYNQDTFSVTHVGIIT